MEEANLERRMQILSSEKEREQATLMRLQKKCQSRLQGQKGQ
jgi:hypothetical protein